MTGRRKTRHDVETTVKVEVRRPAPEGASDFEGRMASLKRCPDTTAEFFRSLIFALLFSVISSAILCPLSTHARRQLRFRRCCPPRASRRNGALQSKSEIGE